MNHQVLSSYHESDHALAVLVERHSAIVVEAVCGQLTTRGAVPQGAAASVDAVAA